MDHTHFLRVRIQNTQHSFNLYGDGIEIESSIDNLHELGAFMFAPIRPNVNWHNQNNWVSSKQLFHPCFQQVHVLAVSSDIGLEPQFAQRNLIGGLAISTFGLCVFKVSAALPN